MPFVLAVLGAAVLFGTTGTAQALGPETSTPASVGVVRLVVGGTALAMVGFALAARPGRRRRYRRARLRPRTGALMVSTGVALAAYQPLFFLGTAANGVAVGTVVALGSAPVLAGLGEWALRRTAPGRTWMVATALATAGVGCLALGGGGGGAADPVGILASVAAGASFAIIALAQRRLLDGGWDPFAVTGAMGGVSAAVAAIALPFVDPSWVADPRGAAVAVWLGVITVAVAYALFTWGLTGLSAATAATLTLVEPLTATLLGTTLLGERLGAVSIAGLVVLGAGLALLARRSRSQDPGPYAVEG